MRVQSKTHVASKHATQYTSVDHAAFDTPLSGTRDTSTPHLMPLTAAVASPSRRLEPVERRSSNVVTPPYSIEQWTVSQFVVSLSVVTKKHNRQPLVWVAYIYCSA